ncbi:hypothetical protein F5B18DRAFT_599761 [Nemania serpens]|nr:hypothetical protein F5B18DRAFT_599761 [Nemania serpens]
MRYLPKVCSYIPLSLFVLFSTFHNRLLSILFYDRRRERKKERRRWRYLFLYSPSCLLAMSVYRTAFENC